MNDKLTISENCGLGMPSGVLYQAMVVDPELYLELAGVSWRSGLPKRHQMKRLYYQKPQDEYKHSCGD